MIVDDDCLYIMIVVYVKGGVVFSQNMSMGDSVISLVQVELEKLRLLCERIVKREKIKVTCLSYEHKDVLLHLAVHV